MQRSVCLGRSASEAPNHELANCVRGDPTMNARHEVEMVVKAEVKADWDELRESR
jgi:hypothetical protein